MRRCLALALVGIAATGCGSHNATPPPATTTQASTTSSACLPVTVAALRAIASGLNSGLKLSTSGASAVKIDTHLYAVSARLLGPGMSAGGPSYATWITDSATSPVIVNSGEAMAAQFSEWPKGPYYGAGEPAVEASQSCVSGG